MDTLDSLPWEHANDQSDNQGPIAEEKKDPNGDINDLAPALNGTEALLFWRELVFIGIISAAQFSTQLGLGQCLALLNVISDHYGLENPGEKSWLIAAYSLTVGTFILLSGRLGDMFGYKFMLVGGFCWFSLWSLVAGLAYYSDHVLFNFARVLQGIGPAMLLPNALAIMGASYVPGTRKRVVFSIFGAMAPTGAILGAVFSGVFNLAFWPWTFWATSIALAALAVSTVLFVHDPPRSRLPSSRSFKQTLIEMDLLGAIPGIIGLVLINFAWNQAGVVTWPKEPYLWVTLILGVLFLAIFFIIEIKVSQYPLIPFGALKGEVAFVLTCISAGWSCFGIWIYYMWLYILNVRQVTPIQGAAWLIPLIISGIAAAMTTGWLLGKIRAGWIMLAAMLAFCIGTALIATVPTDQTYWAQIFVCTIIMPWGMDMSFPAATLILSDAVDKEHQGIAGSLISTVQNYSISLALGFAGTTEMYTTDGSLLKGYRSALYLAIGLSGFGVSLAIAYIAREYYIEWRMDESQSSRQPTRSTTTACND